MLTIIEKAQKEISETGSLSVAARQQLWLALGPAEVNEQHPEAVRKRAQLALACGKKVSRVWSAYDAEDKRPQALLRKISAYLGGKCTAEELDQLLSKTDFMSLIDEERYSNAPLAALAAMYVGFCAFGVAGMVLCPMALLFVKQLHDSGWLRLWK